MAKSLAQARAASEGLVHKNGREKRADDAPLGADEEASLTMLHSVDNELGASADEITRAADSRATRFPGILGRLIRKCSRDPESKQKHRNWWEQLLDHRPLELQKAMEGIRQEIKDKIGS